MTYDLATLKHQVKRVIDYSDGANVKVDKLLEKWEESKRWLIDGIFGGKLIINAGKEMTLDLPAEEKVLKYHEFVDDISTVMNDEELRLFFMDQGWEAFYGNAVRETWDKYGKRIPKGMKMSRALKFFIKDEVLLDKCQVRYSRILQDIKITGELCLSIHPLDYLSISETTHHWRSCHSLDGEYRAGNLSYMVDRFTIVAYLRSKEEHKLPLFPSDVLWNSKKWRMLFYINEKTDLIFASKPYPFDNLPLVNASFKMLEKVMGKIWPEEWRVMSNKSALAYVMDHENSVHFNDALSSATYNPRYKCAWDNGNIVDAVPIMVGEEVKCLKCEKGSIEFGADYSCIECGDYSTCAHCNSHIFNEEAEYLDGEFYCPGCYDELVVWCNDCGTPHNKENPEMFLDVEESEWYCPKCYDAKLSQMAH